MIQQRWNTMRNIGIIGVFTAALLLSGCAAVQQAIQTVQPQLELKKVYVTGITFEAIDLAADIGIHNPNPVGINLVGFDYELKINATSFLKGQQEKGAKIAALGDSDLQIPVKLNYKNIYNTFKTLQDQDKAAYELGCGVSFNLPGLGKLRLPLSTQGDLPMVKLPDVTVRNLKLDKLNLTGAKMELELGLKNSNPFVLLLNRIDYEFAINGKTWASGIGKNVTQVTSKGETALTLPLTLDFTQIGQTVAQLLTGKEPLQYQLRGNLGMDSALPLLNKLTIPLDRTGTIAISR
jgi:LEA14-like dessication related protein